jgi:hypothetical protein
MAKIRIITVSIPRLESDLITTLISGYTTIDMAGNFTNFADAERSLSEITPDLILVGLNYAEIDAVAHRLLSLAPVAKLVAIPRDVGGAYLYKAGGHRVDISDASSQEFAEAILGCEPNSNI